MKNSKCKFLYALLFGVALSASSPTLAETFTVYPSGDTTGVTDHASIQSALQTAAAGGTVKLAGGNFYVNQGIVVEGFNGTLRGTRSNHNKEVLTTLEAVAPFQFSHETGYLTADAPWTEYNDRIMPSVIFFEFPEEKITVRDLIFVAAAPEYVEEYPIWMSPAWSTTALTQFIADFGNDVNATYRNLTFIAGPGDYRGSNVAVAIHSMRGPASVCPVECGRAGAAELHGIGNAVFKHIRTTNVVEGATISMWYKNGTIHIEDVVSNVGALGGLWGAMEMEVQIKDVDSADSPEFPSLILAYIFGGETKVRHLTSLGGVSPGVFIRNAENVKIRDSFLWGANGSGAWWRAPVYIRNDNQNITLVNNTIAEMIAVPTAVLVRPLNNTGVVLKNNYYDPDNFPGDPDGAYAIVLGSDDSRVVEQSLTPEQVLDLGVNNTLILGE